MKRHPQIEPSGDRAAYRLDPAPLGDGGQGEVFKARHKPTQSDVAFKKRKHNDSESVARMTREIEVGTQLAHRNVMPIFDSAADASWFVMPLAKHNALAEQAQLVNDSDRLRRLVNAVTAALRVAHEEDWVHRDVKPENVLRLPTPDGKLRWVLADWGLGRRPRGTTSVPGRTEVGRAYGTEGFAAPELGVDAHKATPAADIYSVGQLIGWAITGRLPQTNIPLLPPSGPWLAVVRECTRHNAIDRPQSIEELVALIDDEFQEPLLAPAEEAEALLVRTRNGDTAALVPLVRLAEKHRDDVAIYLDVLPRLPDDAIRDAVRLAAPSLRAVMTAFLDHRESDWGTRVYKYADTVMGFMVTVARASAKRDDLDLLDLAVRALFAWDDQWDQWAPQDQVKRWLPQLGEEASRIVATALRRYPDAARHLSDLANDTRVNGRVRTVIQSV